MSDDEDPPDRTEPDHEDLIPGRAEVVEASSLMSDRITNDDGEEFVLIGDEYRPVDEIQHHD